jgi:hypothetical protein
MNIYDTKVISCKQCEKQIGEVEYDAKVINPLCGQCANPIPEGDKILYTVSNFQSQKKKENPLMMLVEV